MMRSNYKDLFLIRHIIWAGLPRTVCILRQNKELHNSVTCWGVTIDGVWIRELDLLATCIAHLELHFTDHWHRLMSSAFQVSISHFLATASTEGDSSASRTQVLLSWPPFQNSVNWQLTGSQAGGHFTPTSSLLFTGWLSTEPTTELSLTNQLLHFTQLNCWQLTLELNWPCL
jgi:hypothetical protein